jgi:hypothetical protein
MESFSDLCTTADACARDELDDPAFRFRAANALGEGNEGVRAKDMQMIVYEDPMMRCAVMVAKTLGRGWHHIFGCHILNFDRFQKMFYL